MSVIQLETIPCNLCGATDCETIYEKGGLPIGRCRQCGLVQANPRLPQAEIWKRYSPNYFWDEYMPAHHAPNGEFHEAWHAERSRPFLRLLEPYRQLGTLLEVGCAAGFFLKIAQKDGWQVQGLELMEAAVGYGRDTLGLDIQAATLEAAALPDAAYDAVVLIETVEHLLDPAATLREVYRVLRPGGAVLIAVPNQNSLMRTLYGVDWSVLSPAEHLYYFTEETLGGLLRQVGFRDARFIWRMDGVPPIEGLNPYNTNRPNRLSHRLLRRAILAGGRLLTPLAASLKRTDRLVTIATK